MMAAPGNDSLRTHLFFLYNNNYDSLLAQANQIRCTVKLHNNKQSTCRYLKKL